MPFEYPEKINSNIPIALNIDLPITEDMLSWVKVTPLIIGKGAEELSFFDSYKIPTWKENWEIIADGQTLWKGNFAPGEATVNAFYDYENTRDGVYVYNPEGYYPDWWYNGSEQSVDFSNLYNWYIFGWDKNLDNQYLSRAKYTYLGGAWWENPPITRLVRWINSDIIFEDFRWWKGSDWTIIPGHYFWYNMFFRMNIEFPYCSNLMWAKVLKSDYSIKEVCLPESVFMVVSDYGGLNPENPPDIPSPIPFDTIQIKRNIPDIEEYQISSSYFSYFQLSKNFTRINDNKFNLSISGNIYVSNKPILFDETSYPTLDNTYVLNRQITPGQIPGGGHAIWRYRWSFNLVSSTISSLIKRTPLPLNPTVHTKFLVTIVNPNSNEEVQRYEI